MVSRSCRKSLRGGKVGQISSSTNRMMGRHTTQPRNRMSSSIREPHNTPPPSQCHGNCKILFPTSGNLVNTVLENPVLSRKIEIPTNTKHAVPDLHDGKPNYFPAGRPMTHRLLLEENCVSRTQAPCSGQWAPGTESARLNGFGVRGLGRRKPGLACYCIQTFCHAAMLFAVQGWREPCFGRDCRRPIVTLCGAHVWW
jgi:hypothetical protein